MRLHFSQGFTLIELLIAIAIIGILAAVLIPNLLATRKRTYDAAALTCARSLVTPQSLSQIDNRTYLKIGSASGELNRAADGVDESCKQADVYMVDRSTNAFLASTFTIDVWSTKGTRVFTITPTYLRPDAPGATPFSPTGAGGSNLP